MGESAIVRFLKELRRRRVFRVAGLYVVAMWLLMQAANILFPAWGIPDAAITYLLWAGLLGFPVALAFGWVFDISAQGIRRTQPVDSQEELLRSLPLRRADYVILSAFIVVMVAIVYDTTGRVMETAALDEWWPSAAEIDPNSMAVLPFTSLSSDPEHEYFADGISEEILNRLSAFRELKVIARTSSFAFKDSGYDIARISGLLAVNYLLQGSVRRDGQQLRISAQLVDRAGVQVWSDTFDRELGAIFMLQDELAEAVAKSIVPRIVPPVASERLPDLDAYEAYLAGREILARRESRSGERAVSHFDRAVELDPEFAEAYAERAVALTFSEALDQAQLDLDRALALKPDLARAHAARALLMAMSDPGANLAEREVALRRSLALDPNQVDAWNWLSPVLDRQGRGEEAEQALLRAVRLDPLAPGPNANLAAREFARGESAAAERRLERVLEAPGAPWPVYGGLLFHYYATGQFVKRLELAKRFVLDHIASAGEPPELLAMITSYGILGLLERARYWRDRSRATHPDAAWMRLPEIFLLVDVGVEDAAEVNHRAKALIDTGELSLDSPSDFELAVYGSLAALGGDHATTLRLLEPRFAQGPLDFLGSRRAQHALAWTYLQRGDKTRAVALLEPLAQELQAEYTAGRLRGIDLHNGYVSGTLAGYALTVLMLGDEAAALDLLEEAVEGGWRGYFILQRDARWAPLRDQPRFKAVLARIKADVDAQRAEVEARDAEDDFVARFDAALGAVPSITAGVAGDNP
jgi:TolB-like protein/Flp pilus assembly protein TadD